MLFVRLMSEGFFVFLAVLARATTLFGERELLSAATLEQEREVALGEIEAVGAAVETARAVTVAHAALVGLERAVWHASAIGARRVVATANVTTVVVVIIVCAFKQKTNNV